ncbi:MAG: dihydrolipoyl dehydrogenase, partial [Micromonosporaceae bacterium]
KIGGTCLHRGCIPTKALLHAGEIADQARESEEFGIKVTLEGVDMAGVNSYKDGVVGRLYKGLTGLIKSAKITTVEGEGRLVGPTTVEVGGQRITGKHLVLATGSYSKTLPGVDLDGERIIASEEALNLERVPESAIVLGGGVIGVEFASAWRSFGAEVTIIEALPRLVAAEDGDSSKQVERAFRKRGIGFKTGKPFEKVEKTDSGVRVTIQGGETIEAELLLVAVGRGPTTANLGYEEQGLNLERGFVITDERLRTNLPDVYAVGDIVPGMQLAHRGFQQGIFVAEDIAGLNPAVIDEDGIPRVTYCEPEVASVGLTEAKAKEQYGSDKVKVYSYNLGGNGKSQILKTQGFVK